MSEHNSGAFGGFTKPRRPVELVYAQRFDRITDAIAAERQLKGWSRAKKEALIAGRFDDLKRLARNRTQYPLSPATPSFDKLRMRSGDKLRMRSGDKLGARSGDKLGARSGDKLGARSGDKLGARS